LARERGKVLNPMHRQPLPYRKYSWYSFLLKAGSITKPSGLEPANFRILGQLLNQLRHRVPPLKKIGDVNRFKSPTGYTRTLRDKKLNEDLRGN
jgi:hypothetical protein